MTGNQKTKRDNFPSFLYYPYKHCDGLKIKQTKFLRRFGGNFCKNSLLALKHTPKLQGSK